MKANVKTIVPIISKNVTGNMGVIMTYTAWILLVLVFGWVLVALSWWLLRNFWFKELIIPYSVHVTSQICFAVLFWTLFVYFIFTFKKQYGIKLKFPCSQEHTVFDTDTGCPQWRETTGICNKFGNLPLELDTSKVTEGHPPEKILSMAVLLCRAGRIKDAIGLLRIINYIPNVSDKIRIIAQNRLIVLLADKGLFGLKGGSHD